MKIPENMTPREQQIIQAAVDEAVRLMVLSQKRQVGLLRGALKGIADRCTYMVEEELMDELDFPWVPGVNK